MIPFEERLCFEQYIPAKRHEFERTHRKSRKGFLEAVTQRKPRRGEIVASEQKNGITEIHWKELPSFRMSSCRAIASEGHEELPNGQRITGGQTQKLRRVLRKAELDDGPRM
ncbi:hypothetical protein TELCIR_24158 [Teladorsagia circumcincta]|uniref:Uncharacterized protein n=1 Tax=Teladorsagia circumcincta TaxID=45464 RepID=A0A2G9T9C8_TELCI|nr:hypothetical protein TELCIR_24158 [Teladorsagia circumcincta]